MTRLWLGEGLKATYLRTADKHNFVFARVFLVASDRKLKVLAHLIELFLPYLLKISQGIMDFKYGSIKTLILLLYSYFHTAFSPISCQDGLT